MFCYYLLGGDTVAPSGLYPWLCHAFLVVIFFATLFFWTDSYNVKHLVSCSETICRNTFTAELLNTQTV